MAKSLDLPNSLIEEDYIDLGLFSDFELTRDICIQTDFLFTPGKSECGLIELRADGLLIIRKGFRWKASGPVINDTETRRASLVHDALYLLKHAEVLCFELRDEVDQLLRQHMIEDGCSETRADLWYTGVKEFGLMYWDTEVYDAQVVEWQQELRDWND